MTLQINPRNKRYFLYEGKPIYLIGAGDQYSDGIYKKLNEDTDSGVNSYRKMVVPTIPSGSSNNSPYKYVDPKKNGVDDNWGGFDDDGFWKNLQTIAKKLEKKNIMMFLIVFSTCMRRKGVWGNHLWNQDNGGPISNDVLKNSGGNDPAVTAFYTIGDIDKYLFKPGDIDKVDENPGYNNGWKWEYKSQYRQEQLLAKVMKELPEEKYPNIGIVLQWEIFSGWSSAADWAVHMVDFLKQIRGEDSRPVGLGTHYDKQIQCAIDKQKKNAKDPVFGLLEAYNVSCGVDGLQLKPPYPIIYEGFHVRKEGYYTNSNTLERYECFEAGKEEQNIIDSETCMLAAVQNGLNCSLPFPSYWYQQGNYVKNLKEQCIDDCEKKEEKQKDDCEKEVDKINTKGYDIGEVSDALIKFTKCLRSELDNKVKTWDDEPGGEITQTSVNQCKNKCGS